jgi:dGTPase
LIGIFVKAVQLQERDADKRALHIPEETRLLMSFCQRIVWDYVINNPRLATQQFGQRTVIQRLFEIYLDAVNRRDMNLVPPRFQIELEKLTPSDKVAATRLTVDIVASLADQQAVTLYQRLLGTSAGSVTDIPP